MTQERSCKICKWRQQAAIFYCVTATYAPHTTISHFFVSKLYLFGDFLQSKPWVDKMIYQLYALSVIPFVSVVEVVSVVESVSL